MTKRPILALAPALLAVGGLLALTAHADDRPRAEVGQQAPDFTLTDLEGDEHTLSEYTAQGKVVVLEWFNPDCPYVKKHHQANKTMRDLAREYADQGVVWLAVNSNAAGKQGAGAARNRRAVEEFGIAYPLLLDREGQPVSRLYGARATPHMYVIDADGVLVYAGAIDNDRSARKLGDTNYVEEALDAVLAGEEVPTAETRAYGCSVKYSS